MNLDINRVTKKWYNNDTKEWIDTSVYRIRYSQDVHDWLIESYGGPEANLVSGKGWNILMDKIFMDESAYMMYSLKFGIM
jgi:hypothetical protein